MEVTAVSASLPVIPVLKVKYDATVVTKPLKEIEGVPKKSMI